MYLKEENVYISERENILFDLNEYRIFGITDSIRIYLTQTDNKVKDNLTSEELKIVNEILTANTSNQSEEGYKAVKIHVSNDCNLRCKYCYAKGGNYGKDSSLMAMETAKKIVQCLKKNKMFEKLEYITFFGGEPLLNPNVIEYICKNTYDMNVKYLLQTNGTIISPNIIKILKEYNIVLTISLDGPKYINDFNRVDALGKGTYEKIINNLQTLRANDVCVQAIEATLSKEFIGKYSKKEIAEYIYGITGARLIKVEYDINIQEEEEISCEIDDFFEQCINGKYIIDNEVYRIMKIFLSKKYNDYICAAGNEVVTMDVQGNIFPCQFFVGLEKWKMGDINGIESCNIIDIQKSKRHECRKCPAKGTCSLCIAKGINAQFCARNIVLQERTLERFAKYISNGFFEMLYNNFSSL